MRSTFRQDFPSLLTADHLPPAGQRMLLQALGGHPTARPSLTSMNVVKISTDAAGLVIKRRKVYIQVAITAAVQFIAIHEGLGIRPTMPGCCLLVTLKKHMTRVVLRPTFRVSISASPSRRHFLNAELLTCASVNLPPAIPRSFRWLNNLDRF